MLKPQAFGQYDDGVGTCALGAALDASGHLDDCIGDVGWFFPLVTVVDASPCPVFGCDHDANKYSTVPHLNDDHRWTREQIADWVATIEAQHESAAAPPPLAVPVNA
jgi:hypothetical protein